VFLAYSLNHSDQNGLIFFGPSKTFWAYDRKMTEKTGTVAYITALKEKSFLSPLCINAVPSSKGILVGLSPPNNPPN